MELERQRGISVSSTVLQFPYRDHVVNLLDTPGHKDFSEDTYRVLAGVDAVVMVLDSAKGIEAQTLKLFEVCRSRRLPVLTFLNKYDRPGREPLELLDEIEAADRIAADTGDVAGRGGRGVARRHRSAGRDLHPLRANRAGRIARSGGGRRARRGGRHRGRRLGDGGRRVGAARGRRCGRRRAFVPRRRLDASVRRLGADQLRRTDDPRRGRRPRARPRAAAHRRGRGARPSTPASPPSCSRSRRTWTRRTGIAWRSPGSAQVASTVG